MALQPHREPYVRSFGHSPPAMGPSATSSSLKVMVASFTIVRGSGLSLQNV